jgi:transcriptional regulator with XRE-family HTH domain
MSLGDELRLLRAKAGGPTPFEIEEATGIDPGLYRQLEQRYREMGNDQTVEKLAAYYGCDADALKRARGRSRKALSQQLHQAKTSGSEVRLRLRSGEVLEGLVTSWDLGCIALVPTAGDPLLVVQRHAVVDW